MRDRIDDAVLTERGLRNVRFLLEQQVRLVDALIDAGRDTTEALALLRKLMDIETVLRAFQRSARSAGVRSSAAASPGGPAPALALARRVSANREAKYKQASPLLRRPPRQP